ncbi:MAG TPA: hypothetical protein VHD35_15395 [Chitinophagaceae bacterium]|nr:hypothetical protein [Chitinophagaceae bacterium]
MKTTTTREYKRWTIQSPQEVIAEEAIKNVSFFQKLQRYIERQNSGENRFKWTGMSMIAQSVFITPLVGLVIIMTGNYPAFWFLATAAMYLTFIPSLSGATTRAIIKTFFTSMILNIGIIFSAILVYLL